MRKFIISTLIFLSICGTAFAATDFYFTAGDGYYGGGGLYKLDQDTASLQDLNTYYDNFYYISKYDDDHVMVVDNDQHKIRVYTEAGVLVNTFGTASGSPYGMVRKDGYIYYNTFYGRAGYIDVNTGTATDLGVYYNRDCLAISLRTNGDLAVIRNYTSIVKVQASTLLYGSGFYDMTAGADNYLFINKDYNTILALDENDNEYTAWSDSNVNLRDIDYDPVYDVLYGVGQESGQWNLYKFDFDDMTNTLTSSIFIANISGVPQYYSDFVVTSDVPVPEPLSIGLLGIAVVALIRRLRK